MTDNKTDQDAALYPKAIIIIIAPGRSSGSFPFVGLPISDCDTVTAVTSVIELTAAGQLRISFTEGHRIPILITLYA